MLDVRNQEPPPLLHTNSDPTSYVSLNGQMQMEQGEMGDDEGDRATSQPLPEHRMGHGDAMEEGRHGS